MTQAEKEQDNGKEKEKDRDKEQQRGVKRPIAPPAIPEPLQEVSYGVQYSYCCLMLMFKQRESCSYTYLASTGLHTLCSGSQTVQFWTNMFTLI